MYIYIFGGFISLAGCSKILRQPIRNYCYTIQPKMPNEHRFT